jgi:hypothetical protein
MGSVPHGDLLLFCTAMSGLTYFYHNQVRACYIDLEPKMGNDDDDDDVLAHRCFPFLCCQTSVMSPTLLWVFKWLHKSKSD